MPKFLCAMTGQFPSPPRNRDSTASYSARTGKAEGAASRERAAAGDAEPGARGRRGAGGRRAGRGNAQAPWLAAVLGRPLPPSRSRSWVSAAANLGDLGGGDSSATPRPAPRRSLERGGDGRGRAGTGRGSGRRDPPSSRGRRPGRALGACSGPDRDGGGRAGGPARCLRSGCCAAHLRHFLAAAPQTLARPRPGREGGRRGEGGREGANPAVSTPAGSAPTRRRGPLPSRLSRAPQTPSPGPPTGWTAPPSTPTPGRWPASPDPRGRGFYLGPTTGAWETTKRQIAAAAVRSPLGGAGHSPWGRGGGEEGGKCILRSS